VSRELLLLRDRRRRGDGRGYRFGNGLLHLPDGSRSRGSTGCGLRHRLVPHLRRGCLWGCPMLLILRRGRLTVSLLLLVRRLTVWLLLGRRLTVGLLLGRRLTVGLSLLHRLLPRCLHRLTILLRSGLRHTVATQILVLLHRDGWWLNLQRALKRPLRRELNVSGANDVGVLLSRINTFRSDKVLTCSSSTGTCCLKK